MRTAVRVVLSFLLGFVLTYVIVVAGLFWRAHLNNVFDREPPHAEGQAGFGVTDPRMARYILSLRKSF